MTEPKYKSLIKNYDLFRWRLLHLNSSYRHHHNIYNGFTGYNWTFIGFNGYCNGLDSTGNRSPIGGLVKPLNPNGICAKTHYGKPFFNG